MATVQQLEPSPTPAWAASPANGGGGGRGRGGGSGMGGSESDSHHQQQQQEDIEDVEMGNSNNTNTNMVNHTTTTMTSSSNSSSLSPPAVPMSMTMTMTTSNNNNSSSSSSPAPGATNILPATTSSSSTPTPVYGSSGPQRGDARIVVIVYGPGQERIVSVFAEVLGKPHRRAESFADVADVDQGLVVGIPGARARHDVAGRDRRRVVAIHAHCVGLGMPPDAHLSAQCDYEFLYAADAAEQQQQQQQHPSSSSSSSSFRRDLCRFASFVLGQLDHHAELMAKARTYFISTTFPDVRAALPNIDILTVGADAVEIRVDLLQEPRRDGTFAPVPSLAYVGEQVMLLRQRTELPIIFTTRCTRENGRFPMGDPELYREYLYRAIQWGVEYVDVELWLPEPIRRSLWERRGSSRIMSAFHDFSGAFRWPSRHAEDVFVASGRYADIIKMIAIISDHNENFELEYFRSKMRADHPGAPPFSAVNMGETGQFSRTLNKVFTPITHPLLPIIAAPGQMSAAEINQALALLGQLPKRHFYGILGSPAGRTATPQAPFYEKCFNELGLPHHFAVVERPPKGGGGGSNNNSYLEACCNQKNFGGAYLHPPVSLQGLLGTSGGGFFAAVNGGAGPILSEAARVIGMVDTIVVRPGASTPSSAPASVPSSPRNGHARIDSIGSRGSGGNGGSSGNGTTTATATADPGLAPNTTLILDNASWRGILSTLTRDLAPSAYAGRAAVVLAAAPDDAASALYALRALRVGKVYTVGFKTPAALARGFLAGVEPFNSLESLQRARTVGATDDAASPFVVVSALGPDKNKIAAWVVRAFGGKAAASGGPGARKVFLDLADAAVGVARRGDPSIAAEQSGFAAYGMADTAAFTTVETLRLLVGQNVPYSFVRLASGRGMY